MDQREALRDQVIGVIRENCQPRVKEITGEMRIIEDLDISSDDSTELIVIFEKMTGVKAPHKAWRKVFTVDDIVDLLLKYAPQDSEAKTK